MLSGFEYDCVRHFAPDVEVFEKSSFKIRDFCSFLHGHSVDRVGFRFQNPFNNKTSLDKPVEVILNCYMASAEFCHAIFNPPFPDTLSPVKVISDCPHSSPAKT